MAKTKEPTIIKKYANRRLYNTGTSTYVTLEDLADMVKAEEDFVVYDAKTGEEITRPVLTQIIFEQENKGTTLMPVAFLRQMIRFYGDSMQNLVPSYLQFSIESLTREQEKFRDQLNSSFVTSPFEAIDEQVRRNTEMFERAMRMFLPFGGAAAPETPAPKPRTEEKPAEATELDRLKKQMEDMQKLLDTIVKKDA
ncbi:MAG: polyhydroxyalkanoate synthesis repressor PhaR [Ancalomicrobiaceae bacterium]|nr:polyhydroxyalkanoate synthesis repressor PhaR [Ancalomicrobiaceae bacterium]